MTNEEKILKILNDNNGIITTKQLNEKKINRVYLTRLVKKGHLNRIKKGLYVDKNSWGDEYFNLVYGTSAVFSYETSLYFLGLCESVPIKYNLTLPRGYNGKLNKNKKVVIHFVKKDNFNIGKIMIKSPQGQMISCYNAERSICDLLKDKKNQDIETMKYAIKEYLKDKNNRDLSKLMKYAKIFNVDKLLNTYLEVLM